MEGYGIREVNLLKQIFDFNHGFASIQQILEMYPGLMYAPIVKEDEGGINTYLPLQYFMHLSYISPWEIKYAVQLFEFLNYDFYKEGPNHRNIIDELNSLILSKPYWADELKEIKESIPGYISRMRISAFINSISNAITTQEGSEFTNASLHTFGPHLRNEM